MQIALVQILQQVARRPQADIEFHLRILSPKLLQVLQGDGDIGIDHPDLQQAPHSRVDVPDTVHDHTHILKEILTLPVQAASGLCQLHPFIGAQKQTHPQLILQKGELPADGGLCHMEISCGQGDTLGLSYGRKIFQLF